MSIIDQITGRKLERAIARASTPYVAWFDGTSETGGMSFVGFSEVMERFALHLWPVARVVLVNVEIWDGTAARYGVIGSPELLLFKNGKKIAHHIGIATLPGLRLWASPHLTGSTIAVEWADRGWQSAVGPMATQ
jgi:hypothetical protein